MKNKVLKIMVFMIILILIQYNKSFAAGATISVSKNEVKAGETVELYIDLSTQSIGYDLKIETTEANKIENAQLISNLGTGTTDRIYLVQMTSEDQRIIYENGKRIAVIKYTIASDVKEGDIITIKVSGDVAGQSSSERNTMDEQVTLKVIGENTENNENNTDNGNKEENKKDNYQEEITKDENTNVLNSDSKVDNTTAKGELPKAGLSILVKLSLVIAIVFAILQIINYKRYRDI